jgi:ATP-dependent helicase/nuclease subunit A
MTRPADLATLLAETTAAQGRAADPSASAWVGANAGTGKTHVLTMRVLRLLLAGTRPERILCLTFTKAAAAEMSTRVFDRLAQWASAPEEKLHKSLTELLGRSPSQVEALTARKLFAQSIETPGGLKVQTIHAFCERLLQRFPLEAGVPPGFSILDDEHKRTLMREAIDRTLAAAAEAVDTPLGAALQTVIVHAVDDRFDQLLQAMIDKTDWLNAVAPKFVDGKPDFSKAEARYRSALGIGRNRTLDDVYADIADLLPQTFLQRAIGVLSGGAVTDQRNAALLKSCIDARPQEIDRALGGYFLTSEGEPRKSLITNRLGDAHPDIREKLTRAQSDFIVLDGERHALAVCEATLALHRLADAVRTDYAARKERRAALDYEDLLAKAAALIADGAGGAAQWVLFKLDEGLDHILVDEAQDTNPTQWRVISGLAGEFFADTAGAMRTVFAVGDEKQSIYSFQGAAPHMLAETGAQFAKKVRDAERPWHDVALTLSFRSTQPILEAVDAVFSDPQRTPGVGSGARTPEHRPKRIGHAGLVEIWETEKPAPGTQTDAFNPLAERAVASPAVRLAERIAGQIEHWLTSKELLESKGRPIRASDILILVRTRAKTANAIIAALKKRKIPVSGADRMKLEQQIAVQDLIAVGEVLLLPEDDLALACVLKNPLIGLDDDDLMRIAPGRKGSLWTALLEAARNGDSRLAAAAETLKRWRNRADYMPPFEFYAELLDRDGGRAKLLARLGPEAADAIDEFMNLALVYDEDAPPSLQGFIGAFRDSTREIKRDLEQGANQVRVMTVHGAKGLQAPIVILPDTCSIGSASSRDALITMPETRKSSTDADTVVWSIKCAKRVKAVSDARVAATASETEERNRLLYVAMTRAEDRLYVAGFEGEKGLNAGCWYELIKTGLASRLKPATDFKGREVLRFGEPQRASPEQSQHDAATTIVPASPPQWAHEPAKREGGVAIPLAPSRLAPLDIDSDGDPVEPTTRPLDAPSRATPGTTVGGPNRFLRGTLTHALLQHLPLLPAERWETTAAEYIARRGEALPASVRASIVEETLAVLRHPDFADAFGPRSRAEVAIVAEIPPPDGVGAPIRVAGQIDRLVENGREVLIVDYKTNRPPPRDLNEVPRAYVLQLAGYRIAVQRIFNASTVRAALLWTDGARIMELPAEWLDAASTELFKLA